jgi:ketosteroid isomerase-like protein
MPCTSIDGRAMRKTEGLVSCTGWRMLGPSPDEVWGAQGRHCRRACQPPSQPEPVQECDTARVVQANVELVRRAMEAANRKALDLRVLSELFHPDHQFISRVDALEGRSHLGVQGYQDWLARTSQDVEWETKIETISQIDDERVLAVMPTSLRGKLSGVAVSDGPLAAVVTVRDGKIARTEVYGSASEALRAAGLES